MDTRDLARKIRIHSVEMVNWGGSSHIGSVLSMADILAVLYGGILNFDPTNPEFLGRDRVILSKGHAGAGIYAVLAECGFFPMEWLKQHCQNGSVLSGHVSSKGVPGVELSTGSLGHGLSVGVGLALAAKMRKKAYRIYVLLGDGECNEGSVWEAVMFAVHHQLNNLVVIVDRNHLQSIHSTEQTLNMDPLEEKWRVFGWRAIAVDGHDHPELFSALSQMGSTPMCIIAETTKGKGVSFMENKVDWHYKTPTGDLFQQAIRELKVSGDA